MKFKKILNVILIMMLILVVVPASASESSALSQNEGIIVTDEIVTDIALEWANAFAPHYELIVDNIIPYYGHDSSKLGYIASYYSLSGTPFGYIVLDFFSEGLIAEFSIEEGALSMVEAIISNASVVDSSRRTDGNIMGLHKTLPFQFAVSLESPSLDARNTETVYLGFEGEIPQDEFHSLTESLNSMNSQHSEMSMEINSHSSYNSTTASVSWWGDVVISSLPSGFTSTSTPRNLNPAMQSYTQSSAESNAGRYACAVQAMMNIARRNGMLLSGTNSFKNTYVLLWDESGTTETAESKANTSSTIMYGSTPTGNHRAAMRALGNRTGKTVSASTSSSPSFTTFRNAVDNGRDSIFSAWVTTNSGVTQGHSVAVAGYSIGTVSGSTRNYLRIADGWNTGLRFVDFGNASFTSKHSTVFTIS